MTFNYLTDAAIQSFINAALAEDLGSGDHSTLASVPANAIRRARLIVKSEGVIAGIELAHHIFSTVNPLLKMEIYIPDGTKVKFGDIAFEVYGPAQAILSAERLVLNCMQRMSAIATKTEQLSSLIAHTNTRLLDTRKTTPNFRLCEKWAVTIGGGHNHRFGLFDMVMLKDNHVDFAGGVEAAIDATKAYLIANKLDLQIEIETRNLAEVARVLKHGGVHRIMVDNFSLADTLAAVKLVNGAFEIEASGGITETSIVQIAETGVNYISSGALTHSAGSLDMSLKAIAE
jgi:nicotinate-nucleotide pyrophosphorylase (carboxylating)